MKKLICGCLVLMLCASMSGCTSKSDTPTNTSAYTEGTYTAAAKGNNGDVSVEVVFTSDAIQSVTAGNGRYRGWRVRKNSCRHCRESKSEY